LPAVGAGGMVLTVTVADGALFETQPVASVTVST
jgi:hypothetical protein